MNGDDDLLRRLGDSLDRAVPDAPPERIAAVRAAALRQQAAAGAVSNDVRALPSRRALLISGAAAAVGAVGGVVGANLAHDDPPAAAPSPPTEALSFAAGPAAVAGSTLTGKVINHTWGVELLLDATGLPVGDAFRVVYLDVEDAPLEAGGFVGAELPIHCRCNAPLLRDRIGAIEIRDRTDDVVARADFV